MKKWYQWLYFVLFMVVNLMLEDFQYFKNPNVIAIYYGVMIGIMIILSVLQYVCDQKGEKGRKVFRYVINIVILLLVVFLGCLIVLG